MRKHQAKINMFYVLLFMSFGFFATDIYLPSFPAIAKHFNASESLVKITLFSYMATFSLTPLIFGPISDHTGRKKVTLIGLVITLIATIGCYFSPSIYWLVFNRLVQGIGTGIIAVTARAMVADSYSGKNLAKQVSIISLFMPFFTSIAPTIGGFIQQIYGWQSVFLFLVCYFIFILLGTYLVTETLKEKSEGKIIDSFRGFKTLFKNAPFMLYGFCTAIPIIGAFAYITSSPFLFQVNLGLTPIQYGYLSLLFGGIVVVLSLANVKLLNHFSLDTLINAGGGFIVLAGALLLFFHIIGKFSFLSLYIPCIIFFCSVPILRSNSIAKTLGQISRNFGTANALLFTTQMGFGALTSFVFSFIKQEDGFILGSFFFVLGLLSFFVTYLARKEEKKRKAELKKHT